MLAELGDPVRLAAGYSGRPLYLIGPSVYPQWRRTLTLLLSALVPLVTAINLVVRLFVDDVAQDGFGPVVVGALTTGFIVAVNVVFWVTVVFALAERGRVTDVDLEWDPDQLPDDDGTGRVGLGETVASVGFLVAAGLAMVWQQTSSPVTSGGESVPVLDPALWSGRCRGCSSCSRARPSWPSSPTAVAAGRPGWRPPTWRSTSRSPCRCCSCCGATHPVQRRVRRGARRGRLGRRRARPHPQPRPSGSWSSWSGAWSRRCRTCAAFVTDSYERG